MLTRTLQNSEFFDDQEDNQHEYTILHSNGIARMHSSCQYAENKSAKTVKKSHFRTVVQRYSARSDGDRFHSIVYRLLVKRYITELKKNINHILAQYEAQYNRENNSN